MNSFSSMYLQVLGSSLKRFTVWIIQMICSLRLNIHFITLKKQGTTDKFFSESCALFHLYIISEFTISVARLQMLFIFCTHNVGLSAFNFSGIFFSASAFISSSNIFSACSSIVVNIHTVFPKSKDCNIVLNEIV